MFVYIILVLFVACLIGISIWFIIKNNQSDALYEQALDEIYTRKRK